MRFDSHSGGRHVMLATSGTCRSGQFFDSIGFLRVMALLLAVLLIGGGCTTTRDFSTISALESRDEGIEIVLMPLDVELSVLTMGGMLEPRADWTRDAKQYILTALETEQLARGSRMLRYEESDTNDPSVERLVELERLHGAVGLAIQKHQYEGMKLPTKNGALDWTLGPEVTTLAQKYDADYALFIRIRDSYSSAGRVLVRLAAAAFGVYMQGGEQYGFASLVDLRSGDIVWFNRLISVVGDLRTEEPAAKTVSLLLEGLPQ